MTDEILSVLDAAFSVVREIIESVRDGKSDEEIRERIARPGGVGQRLIDAVRSRRSRLEGYVENG